MRFDERNGASVVERAFKLLLAFGPDDHLLSLADLAERSELPKPTTLRLARQLVSVGALQHRGSYYGVGMKLFELGSVAWHQQRLRDASLPFMQDLCEATHEVVHLGVLADFEVLYIEQIRGSRSLQVSTRVGSRRSLHNTALGKAMLAYLPPSFVEEVVARGLPARTKYTITSAVQLRRELARVVKEGVAYDREEAAVGIACVAAPLLDPDGQCRVALSISGSVIRFDPELSARAVRMAALGITRALQGAPWPT